MKAASSTPVNQSAALEDLIYRIYNKSARVTYDSAKRERALAERGLDFEPAPEVFAGLTLEVEDDRRDYGEKRILCAGFEWSWWDTRLVELHATYSQ